MTRQGMLSVISSIYVPLGLACPFLLQGRRLLQGFCQVMHGWDEMVPKQFKGLGENLLKKMHHARGLWLNQRSITPSEVYGQSTYLQLVNVSGKIHCCLLMGKSRVTPKKYVTIPRPELIAAVLSVKIAALIRRELDIEWKNETFWTDSKVVLGYINNNTKKFKIFVANRIQQIHEGSNVSQWRYVPSKMNPADDASRRLDANPLIGLKDQIFFCTMKLLGQQKEQKPSLMKIQK